MNLERIYSYSWKSIYQLYVQKIERKGRSIQELNEILSWLTGYDEKGLHQQMDANKNLKDFLVESPAFHPNSTKITGVICGYRVEEIEDPILQKIRYMDKIVDELAKGKSIEKICRV